MKKLILLLALIASAVTAQAQKEHGYLGFFEIGHNFGHSELESLEKINNSVYFSTTHGYQFTSNLFIGGGIGMSFWEFSTPWNQINLVMTSPYAMVRYDYRPLLRFGFFFANKIGFTRSSHRGFCFFDEPVIGTRYQLNSNIGLFFSVGYQVGAYTEEHYYINKKSLNGLSVSLGIDFQS